MSNSSVKRNRAFELDFLRGIAIIMMMFMHFSYDIRYEFGFDTFEYLKSNWFWEFVHPIIIVLFVGLSGLCCSFSRNNLKRGLKLLTVALAFTGGTYFVTKFMGIDCLILFNVLHMLSVSTLIYALVTFIEKKTKMKPEQMTFILIMLGIYIIILNNRLYYYDYETSNMLLYPIGIAIQGEPIVADYMPLVPWLGVFLTGAGAGRMLYSEKKTLFPGTPDWMRRITAPFEFLGRHSLIVYIVHQPVIYGILYVIFLVLGKV